MSKVVKQVLKCSYFLDAEQKLALGFLLKAARQQYAKYPVGDMKRQRMYWFSLDMWNDLQNEFYETADISLNTFWKWQDRLDQFDKCGYLFYDSISRVQELTSWAIFMRCSPQKRVFDVLKFIRDCKIDGLPPEIVDKFRKELFSWEVARETRTDEKGFSRIMMKWFDLTRWSPWKLSLLDDTFSQPVSVHYEDEFNPDVEDCDAYLD